MSPKPAPTATIKINQPSPKYGDFIDFTVDVSEPVDTYLDIQVTQLGGVSNGGGLTHFADQHYVSEQMGLYAPNWPVGAGGSGKADVLLREPTHGASTKRTVLGSTTFTVAPS